MNKLHILFTVLLLIFTISIQLAQCKSIAYFAFTDYSGKEFIFEANTDKKIKDARAILSGEETMATHVFGRIRKNIIHYNPGWDFYLDPDNISFFDIAIEVCDSSIQYLEDHLDEACGAFLPGCMWCPWSSRLTREVNVTEIQDNINKYEQALHISIQ